MTGLSFCLSTHDRQHHFHAFSEIWYGIGLVALAALSDGTLPIARIRNMEKNLDIHIFCNGHLLKRTKGTCPSPKVFDRYQGDTEERMKES